MKETTKKMKVVILAGGYGTRISEETKYIPKPMIEIGDKPILWHIIKYYSSFGYNDFIICLGYKQHVIKEYFSNYYLYNTDVTFDMSNNNMEVHQSHSEPWKISLIDTGLNTMTGGRVKRIKDYIGNEPFMLTYGDGVCDVDLDKLLEFHKKQGKIATITAVQPGGRFGALKIDDDGKLKSFEEKKKEDGGWVNGGFMVLNPEIFDYIEGDSMPLEKAPFEKLASEGQMSAYKHDGFWQCMDTLKDKTYLEKLISEKDTPWVRW